MSPRSDNSDKVMAPPTAIAMTNTFDEKRRIALKDAGDLSRPPETLLEAAARKVLDNLARLAAATDYTLCVGGGANGTADGASFRAVRMADSGRPKRMLVPTAPRKFAEQWVKAVNNADTKWTFKREVVDILSKDITFKAIDLMTYVNRPAVQKKLNKAVQSIIDEIHVHSGTKKPETPPTTMSSMTTAGVANAAAAASGKEQGAHDEGCLIKETAGARINDDDDDDENEYDDEESEGEGEEEEKHTASGASQLDAKQLRFLKRLRILIDGPRPVNESDCHKTDLNGKAIVNQEWIIKYTVKKGIFSASMEDEFTVVGGKIQKLTRRTV